MYLRSSASAIWTECHIAPTFWENCAPEEDSDPAREGTCAAWVAELVLNGQAIRAVDLLGEVHENGWEVTQDMVYHVQGYVDTVVKGGGVIEAEQFVSLTDFIGGTLDCSSLVTGDLLRIIDLKYGYVEVNPRRNTQLGIYATAKLLELIKQGVNINRVELQIYQPRCAHEDGIYRTWSLTPDELLTFGNWIIDQGLQCQQPNNVATVGKHCKHCRARSSCQALGKTVQNIADAVVSSQQYHIPLEMLGIEMDMLDIAFTLLSARKTGIEAEVEAHLNAKRHVQGWYMKPRLGRRKIIKTAEEVEMLTGIKPVKEALMSPKELEQAGASVAAVKAVSETPSIARKLSKLDSNEIAKQFENKGRT